MTRLFEVKKVELVHDKSAYDFNRMDEYAGPGVSVLFDNDGAEIELFGANRKGDLMFYIREDDQWYDIMTLDGEGDDLITNIGYEEFSYKLWLIREFQNFSIDLGLLAGFMEDELAYHRGLK